MRISLDWDNITKKEAIIRCKKIMHYRFVECIDLYLSPNGCGFHVYIHANEEFLTDYIVHITRQVWLDDPKRLEMDERYRNFKASTLFQEKHIDGKILREKFIMDFSK